MANLEVEYMGIKLKNPLIVGASELTADMETIGKIGKAGAGAMVIKSLFEEQIQLERFKLEEETRRYDELQMEMVDVFPDVEHGGPDRHIMWVGKAVNATEFPVIASLNATSEEVWVEYAKRLEETGVDGLELNLYSNPESFEKEGAQIEMEQIKAVERVVNSVEVPVSVKLSLSYTNPLNFIYKLDALGVEGFVLFNRFFQSDIDVMDERMIFSNTYSKRGDYKPAIRYSGLASERINGDICASGGIYSGMDALKTVMAGASAFQTVSSLYKNGLGNIKTILDELNKLVDSKGAPSLEDLRGNMAKGNLSDPFAFTRTQYIKMLNEPDPLEEVDPRP